MAETERSVFKIFIRGSIEQVWREITKTDEPQACFFNMQLHTPGLKPGQPIQMRTKSNRFVGAVGEVLEFDPPHRYSHTFRFTQHDDPPCVVTYELKPVTNGVEFTMILDQMTKGTKTTKQMQQGGTWIIGTLKSVVETGRPSFGVRVLYRMLGWFEPLMSPKKTRVEYWPLENPDR